MNILELNSNLDMWGVATKLRTLLAPKSLLIGSGASQMLDLVGLLFIFCLVVAGALFATRLIASKASGYGYANNNIKIIETYRLSNTSAIQIIRVADKFLAIGISKDNISLLAELDEDSVIINNTNTQFKGIDFSDILVKAKNKLQVSGKSSNKKVD